VIGAWAFAFALTQLFEMPVYWFALRPRPARERLAIGFGASLLTHPLVWVFILLPIGTYDGRLLPAEVFAWLAEAAWLRRFGVRDALGWSLVANGTSYGLGSLVYWLVGR
jgi:hypothetical protein